MKVADLAILRCDAGWRNYHFLKLTTDEGIVGWSEFDEGSARRGSARSSSDWRRGSSASGSSITSESTPNSVA